jgi:hypothetical protein
MKRTITKFILPLSACLFATAALSQGQMMTRRDVARPQGEGVSVEIKPLPTILTLIPGVGGIGAAVETPITNQMAGYVESNFLDSNLPEGADSTLKDRFGEGLYGDKVRAVNVDVGGRYYTTPWTSSWYGGVKVGYTTVHADWLYHDEKLTQRFSALTPGVAAGYRWKWDNNVLVRLGAGVGGSVRQFEEVKIKTGPESNDQVAQEGRKKLDDAAKQVYAANVDLGVGYVF